MTENNLPNPVKLTGKMLNFSRLKIQGTNVDEILANISKKLNGQQQTRLPIVLSCDDELDLQRLLVGLWELGLQPIGITSGVMDKQAQSIPIAIFPADGQRIDGKPVSHDTAVSHQKVDNHQLSQPNTTDKATLVHQQILRSGQIINHAGGDVVLTKGVNVGAEAITNYNLYIYGKAEGRIVAGATGDVNAKIFCEQFNPTLVSVAGTYCIKEDIPPEFLNQAVIVSVDSKQTLVFNLMKD